jgi:protoporphyrinogen oxidase
MINRCAPEEVIVLGGGPAGLTAAHELARLGLRPIVVEKRDVVGGLARTEEYRGYRFDMGGHRFFTKSPEVRRMWREVLGDDFRRVSRLSRIYYRGRFFRYPLQPFNALFGLGVLESARVVLSYAAARAWPHRPEDTFEQWVTNRFGARLFETFFRSYTEKVWGISCSELKAEWAAQRIKDLSLVTAILDMFLGSKGKIKTLIEEFDYPRLGPGMMWQAVADRIEAAGGSVRLGCDVVRIRRAGGRIESVVVRSGGKEETLRAGHFISSMPVSELIAKLDPPPPPGVLNAAGRLTYRDFLTVGLIIDRPRLFPDNWLYIHDPEVKVGRIQNFKNWSPDMVPDPAKTSLGMEYFCTEGDDLWRRDDAELVALAGAELARLGLADPADVEDGVVFRVPRAYPIYDSQYRDYLAQVRQFVDGLSNAWTIGRNGLHRYNNQDHAMLTGLYAARNLALGESNDLWAVNADQEYHEVDRAAAEEMPARRRVPAGALGLCCAAVVGAIGFFLLPPAGAILAGLGAGVLVALLARRREKVPVADSARTGQVVLATRVRLPHGEKSEVVS